MTPQEKAEELFRKHFYELFQVDSDISEEILISTLSKKCALISVDEILDMWKDQQPNGIETWLEVHDYWVEVKNEINKL